MEFDGPIFLKECEIKDGWVNVGQYKTHQSLGWCYPTRGVAITNATNRIVYRIHVKVKHTAQP